MATIQIVGGGFQNAQGQPIANGSLTFKLSKNGAVGVTNVCPGLTVTVALDDTGNVAASSAFYLWPNDVMTPDDTYYTMNVMTALGQLVGTRYVRVLSSPNPFDLSNLAPAF